MAEEDLRGEYVAEDEIPEPAIQPAHTRLRLRIRVFGAVFALVASSIMVLTSFYPVAQCAAASAYPAYSYQPPDAECRSPDDTHAKIPKPTVDLESEYEKYPSIPISRETSSIYDTPAPVLSTASLNSVGISLSSDSESVSYVTQFGVYSYPNLDPSTLHLMDLDRTPLCQARFTVSGSGTDVGLGKIVAFNGTSLLARQTVVGPDAKETGSLFVRTDFFADRGPKITAWVEWKDDSETAQGLRCQIGWVIETPDDTLKLGDQTVQASLLDKESYQAENATSFEAGSLLIDEWLPRCTVDWSDAGKASVSVTKTLDGLSASVWFPEGTMYVDPTVVGTSTMANPTPGSPLRNLVFRDGIYWLFFYSASGLAYAKSPDGGATWSSPLIVPGSGSAHYDTSASFDVALCGNHIAVCWYKDYSHSTAPVYFNEGDIGQGIISWQHSTSIYVIQVRVPSFRMGGLALTNDGSSYFTFSDRESWGGQTTGTHIHTLKKSRSDTVFTEFSNPFPQWLSSTGVNLAMPRFVAHPDGKLALVTLLDHTALPTNNNVLWDIYEPSIGVWERSVGPWNCTMNTKNYMSLSACAGDRNQTFIASTKSDDHVQYTVLNQDSGGQAYHQDLQEVTSSVPTISVDSEGLHYVMFTKSSRVWEKHTLPDGTFSQSRQLFLDENDSPALIGSGESFASRIFLSYTNTGTTPKQIMFGALPLDVDSAGSYGQPWNAEGVNSDQPFSVGTSDCISPGNGLLYVFQSDFVLPGRWVDMSISHFYCAPKFWVHNATGDLVPYGYSRFPWCDMGERWQLNLPWIEDGTYLHLWGGSKYKIQYDQRFYFNNTVGQVFSLLRGPNSYYLDLQDGSRMRFDLSGAPQEMFGSRMLEGSNPDVAIEYGPGNERIQTMTDYLGRTVCFNYSGEVLSSLDCGGNAVTFHYSNGYLDMVTDATGKSMYYLYDSGSPAGLLAFVTYPHSTRVHYTYSCLQIGPDAHVYVVSSKTTDDGTTSYSYSMVDGSVTIATVDDYTPGHNSRWMRGTVYNFDKNAKATVVTHLAKDSYPYGTEVIVAKRTLSWYSPDGRISRTESYCDVNGNPDEAVVALDNKGNTVYSRDPTGHETFASFSGSNLRNAYYAPALFNRTGTGKLAHDDFNDYCDDGWAKVSGGGQSSIGLYRPSEPSDPSYKVTAFLGDASFANGFDPVGNEANEELVLDCLVVPSSGNGDQRLILSCGSDDIVTGLRFNYSSAWGGSYISFPIAGGSSWQNTWEEFTAGTEYKVTLEISTLLGGPGYQDKYYHTEFYLDGRTVAGWNLEVQDFVPLRFFRVDVKSTGTVPSVVIDDLKVFRNWEVTVTGSTTDAGRFVELYASDGGLIDRDKMVLQGGTVKAVLVMSHHNESIPYANLVVRNWTGVTETIDAYREIWGGDTYEYRKPRLLNSGITRTSSGFGSEGGVFFDDNLPTGSVSSQDFNWITNGDFVLSGEKCHHDSFSTTYDSHDYRTPWGGQYVQLNGDNYLVQYAYLAGDRYPTEAALTYSYYLYTPKVGWIWTWSKVAAWGPKLIYPDNSTAMGGLPSPNQWVMFVVKAQDIGLGGANQRIHGMEFQHFGGDPFWDRSGYSTNVNFGSISLTGVPTNYRVDLKGSNGSVIASRMVTGETTAILDLYAAGVRCFPLVAYFAVFKPDGSLDYESPVFTDIYANDVYAYNGWSSYPFEVNPPMPDGVGKTAVATMYYLDVDKRHETYNNYGFKDSPNGLWEMTWLANTTWTLDETSWLCTKYTYDQYGNVRSVEDPSGAILNYSYSHMGTYLNSTWINVGPQNLSKSYDYYDNGLLKIEKDATGNYTRYEYDSVGRVTKVTHPRLSDGTVLSECYEYDDTALKATSTGLSGSKLVTRYDGMGRVTEEDRLWSNGTFYSWRWYLYGWNGQVEYIQDSLGATERRVYDNFDRVLEVHNSDGTTRRTVYNDRNRTVTGYDEMNSRTDQLFDANDRLVQSIQYIGGAEIYANMTYDSVGDLIQVETCRGVTEYLYDNLGRAVEMREPWGGCVAYTYDDAGRLKTKQLETGELVINQYDVAGRITSWTCGYQHASYEYDSRNNIIEAVHQGVNSAPVMTARNYDSWNRVVSETTTLFGQEYRVSFGYDDHGDLETVDLMDGLFQLTYAYDEFHRPVGLADTTGQTPAALATLCYNSADRLTSIQYGNGLVTNFFMDPERGWIDQMQVVNGTTPLLDLAYGRDPVGRITSVGAARTYTYDNLGQLGWSNDTSQNGYGSLSWAYDHFGNRQIENGYQGAITQYEYDSSGRLESTSDSWWYSYIGDSGIIGTRTSPSETWSYDYEISGQLARAKRGSEAVERFWYDAFGRCVRSQQGDASSGEVTIFAGSTPLFTTKNPYDPIHTYHAFVNGLHIAKKVEESTLYYHGDAFGSVRIVSNQNAAIVLDADYLPFGECYRRNGLLLEESYGFVDARTTVYSGLTDLGARSYSAELGRFYSPDSVMGSLSRPISLNRWAYCLNDPVNRIDKDGTWSIGKFFGDICNVGKSLAEGAVDLLGDAVEFAVDTVASAWEAAVDLARTVIDVGLKLLNDVKNAVEVIGAAALTGLRALEEAWDNLDPGWKQWLMMGLSIAASIALPGIGGVLVSCVLDGTFTDMLTAITTGDWALLAMSVAGVALAGVGVYKALKAAGSFGKGVGADIGKAVGKSIEKKATSKVAVIGEGMEKRVKPFAAKYGGEVMPDLPKGNRLAANRAWINQKMDEGYTIVDLGPKGDCPMSKYYIMELGEIANRGYEKYLPVWGIFG